MSTSPRRTAEDDRPPGRRRGACAARRAGRHRSGGAPAAGRRPRRRAPAARSRAATTTSVPGGGGGASAWMAKATEPAARPAASSRRRQATARRSSRSQRSSRAAWTAWAGQLTAGRRGASGRRSRAGTSQSASGPGRRGECVDQQVAHAHDVLGEHPQHLVVGDALAVLEPGVEVGDEGDRRVAEPELAGERRLRYAGHADHRPALRGVPQRLGAGGEARPVDDDEGAAVDRPAARGRDLRPGLLPARPGSRGRRRRRAPPGRRASKNVWPRPQVRSTTWSGTTIVPGPCSARSEPDRARGRAPAARRPRATPRCWRGS